MQRASIFYLTYTQWQNLRLSILYVFLFMSCFPLTLCFCRRLSRCLCLCLSLKNEAMKSDIAPIICPVCLPLLLFFVCPSAQLSTNKMSNRLVKINPFEFLSLRHTLSLAGKYYQLKAKIDKNTHIVVKL